MREQNEETGKAKLAWEILCENEVPLFRALKASLKSVPF